MFSRPISLLKLAYERATPQVRRPAYMGMAVCGIIGILALWGMSNTRNPLSMPSALGGIAVSQAIWGLKPSNLLMVLPIGSFLVVLARSFIGMKAFGLFTPMLIALAFLQIGPIFGPIVLGTAVGIGMVVAPSLLKLRMTRVGFLGVLISLVVFVLAALQGILDTNLQVDAMPVVVTALVVERWWRQWEKDGYFEAAHIAFNTLMLALVIQFVMVSEIALRLIEVSPLLLPGFAAVAITVLGRYRGLRMTEIGRFFPIWYEGWRRKMGWDEVIPEDAIDEVLAARASIDDEDRSEKFAPESAFAQTIKPTVGMEIEPDFIVPSAPMPDGKSPDPVRVDDETDADTGDTEADNRLTQNDWDRIRAELRQKDLSQDNALPLAETPFTAGTRSLGEAEGGGLSAFFAQRTPGRIIDPALLTFLRSDGRHSGDQSAQRDYREIQQAGGDRAGTRQGRGKSGAGGTRGHNHGNDRRHLRLWSA
ncbi:MAG: 7TM domain-containing protein [Alteraurantiacibacter sp.]